MRPGKMSTIILLALACAGASFGQAARGGRADSPPADVQDVSTVLADAIAKHGVPGMVAAVIEGDRVVATGVAGVRKRGRRDKITLDDRFHIGSCTKTM